MLKIDNQKLYHLYMERINKISDDLEDKSYFCPKEIVDIIVNILEDNPELIKNNK
jgi:hypothetical protein